MLLFKEISRKDYELCFELDSKTISLWSKKQWKSEFNKNGVKVIAITLIKEVIGICVFQVVIDEVLINYFSINENYRREGYGSLLMSFLIKRFEKLNLKKLSLEVSEANLAANEFYNRFEFMTVGRRENYYRDGTNAVLKEKFLNKK